MRFLSLFIFAGVLLLTACTAQPLPDTVSDTAVSSSSSSEHTWTRYTNERLGVSIEYPSDVYTVGREGTGSLEWEGGEIPYDGVRLGDGRVVGLGLHISSTTNPEIVDYLQSSSVMEKEFNGLVFTEYRFDGWGDIVGYLIERDGTYYLFRGTLNNENPYTEQMMQTVQFESNRP